MSVYVIFFFFKQNTAYEMRISDWSSDVCSSDLICAQQLVIQDREVLDRDGLEAEVECAGLMGGIDARFDQPHELVEDRILQGDWKRQEAIEPALDRRRILDHRPVGCFDPEARQLLTVPTANTF